MYDIHDGWIGDPAPMYVQTWRSAASSEITPRHIVLVHGAAHTGACWTSHPGGEHGWAALLADRGWTVHTVDWPGTGRSPRYPDFLETGPEPIVAALTVLLERLGAAVLVGHSIGFPLAAKAFDTAGPHIEALIGVAPSAPGNLLRAGALSRVDSPLHISAEQARRLLTNSPRFSESAITEYLRSLCDYSGRVANACGDTDGTGALVIENIRQLRELPCLVVASDGDALTPLQSTIEIAQRLGARHIELAADWNLHGFGHMMPIETGTAAIVERIDAWLAEHTGNRCNQP